MNDKPLLDYLPILILLILGWIEGTAVWDEYNIPVSIHHHIKQVPGLAEIDMKINEETKGEFLLK